MTYTQEQLELAVKEAAHFAYEQGKNEAFVNAADYIQSLMLHPTTLRWSVIVEKIRSGRIA
jgi:hypothetical protein